MKENNWIIEQLNLDNVYKALLRHMELRRELFEIETKDYLAKTFLSFVILLLILGFALVIFLFATLALALFLNEITESTYWGFLIVSGFYLVAGILVYFLGKRLIINIIYRIVFEKKFDEFIDADE